MGVKSQKVEHTHLEFRQKLASKFKSQKLTKNSSWTGKSLVGTSTLQSLGKNSLRAKIVQGQNSLWTGKSFSWDKHAEDFRLTELPIFPGYWAAGGGE